MTGWRRLHPQLYRWSEAPNVGTPATLYNRSADNDLYCSALIHFLVSRSSLKTVVDIMKTKHIDKTALGLLDIKSSQSTISVSPDERISQIRRDTDLLGFWVEPSLVRHIGLRSSLGREHEQVTAPGYQTNMLFVTEGTRQRGPEGVSSQLPNLELMQGCLIINSN